MHYTLGLDIGISSVGWAVLQNMSDGEPFKIEDLGVRIFEKAEQPKTGASLALSRREARGARRRLRRRRHRKERVKALLQETGCIDREELEALLEAVKSGASGEQEGVQTLPDWLVKGLAFGVHSADAMLSALGLDKNASVSQLLAAIADHPLDESPVTGPPAGEVSHQCTAGRR